MDIQLSQIEVPGLFKLANLTIRQGEKVLIQGPSGRGKTTLLHLIAGILNPAAGTLTIGGQNIYQLADRALSEFRKNKIGLIYQKLNLIEHLTTTENMQLVAKKENLPKTDELLKKLSLEKQNSQSAASLSLGEQQRVAIGRLLLQAPEILLADEPTSSLDKRNTENVMSLLLEAAKNKTLVVVSHDERIEKYFDRVLQLEDLIK